jgi:hypothetical protein
MGNLPGSPTAIVQPSSVKLSNRQLPLWALKTFSPSTMARLVSAVPKEFVMTAEDTRFVAEFIDSLRGNQAGRPTVVTTASRAMSAAVSASRAE